MGKPRRLASTERNAPYAPHPRSDISPPISPRFKHEGDKRDLTIIRVPEQFRQLHCMLCAGFIRRRKPNSQISEEFTGTSYNRCIPWDVDDILQFFSRAITAFGGRLSGGSHVRHLLNVSLQRTLMKKFKLSSRRKVFKLMKKKLSPPSYPVLNENRHPRFRNDRPIPFRIHSCCSARKDACWRVVKGLKFMRQRKKG